MNWKDEMKKQADCKVTVCDAITCMYNAYTESGNTFQKRCTLDEITINSKGKCDYFVVKKDKRLPEPKYVNFTPKTVDRLKRTVRENPTQGINEELNEKRR